MSDVKLSPGTAKLIEDARAGDPYAASMLYGQAGAIMRAGSAVPEPLAAFIAERLEAIGDALRKPSQKDYRTEVAKAVVPGAVQGRRPKRTGELAWEEWVALEVVMAPQGTVTDVRRRVAERHNLSEKTVEAAATRDRKKFPHP